jgi:alpha-galactosidase
MKNLISGLLFMLLAFGAFAQDGSAISIKTKNSELLFSVGVNKRLYQNYYGARLSEGLNPLPKAIEAYPGAGMDFQYEPAIRVIHADGNPSIELKYQSSNVKSQNDGAVLTDIVLKDEVYNTLVTLHFMAYADQDVIKTWTDIKNGEAGTITLTNYASCMLHFTGGNYRLTQFHGDYAKEFAMQESRLTSGQKVIDSKLGTRTERYQAPHFFVSLGDKPATETTGESVAGTLAWTGNFKVVFEVDNRNTLHLSAGINNYASEYHLKHDSIFTTPQFIFTYSANGKGQASRNLHTWARNFDVLDGKEPRLTLLNNWETTFFNFDQKKLEGLFDDAKTLGVDLFLLDDGWFGNKFPRDNDKTSLGDWQVSTKKLPDGIAHLVQTGVQKDMKFGIWVEPEMVNPKSELYEKHPNWILKLPNRAENYERNQLILDLTNPEVQNFVFGVLDNLFKENPRLAFIKWDCNRTMTNNYSPYLKKEQSHLFIDYTLGLYKVLKRVRNKYPHVPMMLCSGGGGRADYEALKYFTEFWPSDNTDGAERIYIQWGYSNFFPANTICNHITNWGKQSLKYRTDVAMMGKLGYDIKVSDLKANELEFSKQAVANYKRLSNVIWQGDLYRLVSPYEANRAVLMYVDPSKNKSVLFAYNLQTRYREYFDNVKLQGLDPQKNYMVKEINLMPDAKATMPWNNKVYRGEYLMNIGIDVSGPSQQAFTSTVMEISVE